MSLTLHDRWRAWEGFDWAALDRIHRMGFILSPVGRAKSVVLTEEGLERSRALLVALSGKTDAGRAKRAASTRDRGRSGPRRNSAGG